MGWYNSNKTKEITLKQKHATHIIFYADRQTQARPLLTDIKALNVTVTHKVLIFMQKVKISSISRVSKHNFHFINQSYSRYTLL